MPTVPTVRVATDADLPALRRLAALAFDRERVHRAGVVDLLHHRPGVEPSLRLVAAGGGSAGGSVGEALGFAYACVRGSVGHVDALAVAPTRRRRGVATALMAAAEQRLGELGATSVQFGGNTWYYAWPGIDLAYTAALVMAQRAGFEQVETVHNMDVDLAAWVPGEAATGSAGAAGAEPVTSIARICPADAGDVDAFIAARFDDVWRHEVALAAARERPTAFVARRAGVVVGVAAHGVYRADLFGPLGTDPAVRGAGVGRALLVACLDDMAAAGLSVAQIGWIGPAGFYASAVGARLGRSFAVMAKDLRPAGLTPRGEDGS